MKRLVVFILVFLYCLCAYAEADGWLSKPTKQNFRLYYRLSDINIDSTYLDNILQMDTIKRYLALSPRIDSITIYAYASPEGSFRGNRRLAEKRAEAAKEFILANLAPGSPTPEIILKPTAEHWGGFLKKLKRTITAMTGKKSLKSSKTRKSATRQENGGSSSLTKDTHGIGSSINICRV